MRYIICAYFQYSGVTWTCRATLTAMRESRLVCLGLACCIASLACEDFGKNAPEEQIGGDSARSGGAAGAATSGGDTARGGSGGTSAPTSGGSTSAGGSSAATSTVVETYPKPCADLYDENILPTFELEIAPSDLQAIETDCVGQVKAYHPATLKYGNETASAMVRLKGNWSWRCDKKQYLISFNETDSTGRFHGLRKIVLDAPWYDPTLLAERVGFSFMRRVGAHWSCVNNAKLYVNGEYQGLYVNVERIDKEYLQRHFTDADAEGNLYDGGSELRTNETLGDVSRRDALMKATDIQTIDAMSDLDEAVRYWAAAAILPDVDSYWAGVEINYFLYDHPTRGFLWFPYDMDMTLLVGSLNSSKSSVTIGSVDSVIKADPFTYQNSHWLKERLVKVALSNAHWCERFLEELKAARAAYDATAMSAQLDIWAAQIAEAVETDPRKSFSNADHLNAVATMKANMTKRLAFIDEWLKTATCPVTTWP
ncbi:MAG: CotH kinase family protein [Polyangiaceae bacterium]